MDGFDARALELDARDRLQVEVLTPAGGRTVSGEGCVHLVAHLVAARPGPGSDDGLETAARSELADGLDPRGDHTLGEPPPAGVQDRGGPTAGHGDREAVGGQDHRRDARHRDRLSVGFGQWPAGRLG